MIDTSTQPSGPELRFGSVCSGVEAASTAWEPLGFKPVFFSEIEAFPAAVLQHHWPDVPNHGDMEKFNEWGYTRGSIDVLVGGTPCQSFSVAGLRAGLGDSRGNLALTYMRMVDQLRPRWIVWENVPGVLSSNGGRDFGAILGALDELGYSYSWRVLDAQNFGVAQRRRRVFLIGCSSGDFRDPATVLFEQSCGNGDPAQSRKKREETAGSLIPRVAGSLDTQCGGGKLTHQSANNGHLILNPPEKMGTITARMFVALGARDIEEGAVQVVDQDVAHMRGVRRLTPVECERLQGFPDGHTNIPYRNKPNSPDSPRYKAMGNSMAVPVMRWIGERIQARELKRSCRADCELA